MKQSDRAPSPTASHNRGRLSGLIRDVQLARELILRLFDQVAVLLPRKGLFVLAFDLFNLAESLQLLPDEAEELVD